jgi:hypothetical protein
MGSKCTDFMDEQPTTPLGFRWKGNLDIASKEGSGTRRCHQYRQDQHNAELKVPLAISHVHMSPAISTSIPTTPRL